MAGAGKMEAGRDAAPARLLVAHLLQIPPAPREAMADEQS
jgi:hypothetical protein